MPAVRGIVAGVLFEIAMTPEFDELTPPEIPSHNERAMSGSPRR